MKVSFDLKSNSFAEFYKNDFPNSIKSCNKPNKPEINKNSARNSKKKNRKKFRNALSEFIGKLAILSPQEQKKEIKEFVGARNLTREESVSLTLNILNGLSNYKALSRTDSKIDLNSLQDSTTYDSASPHTANSDLAEAADSSPNADCLLKTDSEESLAAEIPVHIPAPCEKPLKFDFYQTGQNLVVIFYIKNVKSCTMDFIDDRKIRMETCSRIMELEFDRDLEKDGTVQICEFNLKIGIKKLDKENVYFKIIKNDFKGSVQSIPNSISTKKENTFSKESNRESNSLIKSSGNSAEIGGLLPQYVNNRPLKEFGENANPLQNVCGLLNPGIVYFGC